MPRGVERLHEAFRGGDGEVRTWRLYAAISTVSDDFTELVGWAKGSESAVRWALRDWDVRVDPVRGQVHVLGPSGGLPPGWVPVSLPPPVLALPPGK